MKLEELLCQNGMSLKISEEKTAHSFYQKEQGITETPIRGNCGCNGGNCTCGKESEDISPAK